VLDCLHAFTLVRVQVGEGVQSPVSLRWRLRDQVLEQMLDSVAGFAAVGKGSHRNRPHVFLIERYRTDFAERAAAAAQEGHAMTIQLLAPKTSVQLQWKAIGFALWVGSSNGVFVGTIARDIDLSYEAMNAKGRVTGYFETLDEAKASLR
jgi:hypothetical protein